MRKVFWALSVAFTAAAVAPGQTGSQITRDGGFWVQTVSADYSIGGATRARITTRGPVTLNGADGDQLRLRLRKRVRASSESEARRALASIEVRFERSGPLAYLRVVLPPRNVPAPDLEVTAPRRLVHSAIFTTSGALMLSSLGGDVEVSTGGGRIEADGIGGMLVARTGGGEIRIGAVGGLLRCVTGGGPISVRRAGGESWVDTGGGEVVVEEAHGPVHASTGAGNIEVQRALSAVSARTSGGQIKVLDAGGLVTAESAGGGIQVGAARGVRLESVGGGIKLHRVSGEMKASTAVGSILAELLAGALSGHSYLSTGSGDVTVFIPSNLAVTVQAHNDSPGRTGRIVSDFPEVRVRNGASPARGRVVAEGAINGGGPLLTIANADGTIFLRRQK